MKWGVFLAWYIAFALSGCNVPSQENDTEETARATPSLALKPDHWQAFFSPDVPYYNQGDQPVTARAEPSLASPPIGQIPPGAGGYIITCDRKGLWCELPLNGMGDSGWVPMKTFGGQAL